MERVFGGLDTSDVKSPTEKSQPSVPNATKEAHAAGQEMGEMLATQQAILGTLSQMASEQTSATVALERIAAALIIWLLLLSQQKYT